LQWVHTQQLFRHPAMTLAQESREVIHFGQRYLSYLRHLWMRFPTGIQVFYIVNLEYVGLCALFMNLVDLRLCSNDSTQASGADRSFYQAQIWDRSPPGARPSSDHVAMQLRASGRYERSVSDKQCSFHNLYENFIRLVCSVPSSW
jgi:hypothetical protein